MVTRVGTNGDDPQLNGTNSRDTVLGRDGNDSLFGLAGSDLLLGGEGNDRIDGGAGSDRLFGGEGNDTFVFALGNDGDTVYDFVPLRSASCCRTRPTSAVIWGC